MKKILSVTILCLFLLTAFSQAPLQLNYQAVVRDNTGQPVPNNTPVSLTFNILSGSPTGSNVYTETIPATANKFGLVNVQIGSTANLSEVNWGASPGLFLQVQASINGGTLTDMGTTQLLSVPYALYAQTAGGSNAWSLTGNTGTVDGTNFIGTADSVPLTILANNYPSGRIEVNAATGNSSFGYQTLDSNTGTNNSAFGYQALSHNTTASQNTAVGEQALYLQSFNNGGIAWNSQNVAVGYQSLYNNQPDGTGDGNQNAALGDLSLFHNTSGSQNTGIGFQALYNNTTGDFNLAVGTQSLDRNNTGAYNTGCGYQSMYSNTTGFSNTAVGANALGQNSTAARNTAVGYLALFTQSFNDANSAWTSDNVALGYRALYLNQPTSTTTGVQNTAIGTFALDSNTVGAQNTAVGVNTLQTNTIGSDNTAIGYNANVSDIGFSNSVAIGANCVVNADAKIRLGALGTVVEGGSYSTVSDGRFKDNVQQDVVGLDFIKLLRPVTYNFNGVRFEEHLRQQMKNKEVPEDLKKRLEQKYTERTTGFIAQEVEAAAEKAGYEGFKQAVYKPTNATDNYGLSYQQFVVPLVKAAQELSAKQDASDAKIREMQKVIDMLQQQIQQLKTTTK